MRKTYEVQALIIKINKMLMLDLDQARKESLCVLLESVLHETGNYRGFSYTFDWNAYPPSYAKAIQYNRQYD